MTGYSRGKVQAALKRSTHQISPQRTHYQTLQVDEFWTFVGKKRDKVWLIYAYDQAGGEIEPPQNYRRADGLDQAALSNPSFWR